MANSAAPAPPAPSLAPAPLNLIIPQEVRYDGVQPTARGALLQFTDLAPGPAHGATFYLLETEATSVALARLTAHIRRTFARAGRASTQPLPPAYQRQPRRFAAPDRNHY